MLHLANDGYAVYGVDASREMINIASKRLSEYGNITLVEGRDDEVVLPAKVTGILCMFSTFNEKLTDTDVRTALLNYKRNLLAGGVIIIDMIDEAYFRSSFKKWCEEETRTARVRSSVIIQYDESRIARIRKEYKVYNDDGRSEVFEDEFALRLYQDSQLMQIVEEVGFEVMRIDKGFVDENRKERLVLVGRG